MVARNISIAEYAGSRIHISSVSTARSVELIRKAKSQKLPVTASVNVLNLCFEDNLLEGFDSNYKVNPPLRTKQDIVALLKGINDGTIDCITSDHSPEEVENKMVEFDYASFGTIGLETAYALLSTHLGKNLSLENWVKCVSTNPRAVFALDPVGIVAGVKANLTLFDPELKWTFEEKHIRSKSRNTPLLGMNFKGKVLGIYNRKTLVKAL